MPCYEASAEYLAEIAFYVGFIENVLSTVTFTDVIIMVDMNFEVSNTNSGYDLFKSLLSSYSIVDCDEFIVGRNRHTYVNEALGHMSCIDHFFITPELRSSIHESRVIDSGANTSDHRPVVLHIKLPKFTVNTMRNVNHISCKVR